MLIEANNTKAREGRRNDFMTCGEEIPIKLITRGTTKQIPGVGVWGFSGIIGVYNPKLGSDQLTQIDTSIDDADPNTGGIHTATGWVFYGIP